MHSKPQPRDGDHNNDNLDTVSLCSKQVALVILFLINKKVFILGKPALKYTFMVVLKKSYSCCFLLCINYHTSDDTLFML